MLDTIKTAISRVAHFNAYKVYWGNTRAIILGDRSAKFPALIIHTTQDSGVGLMTSCGAMQVRYKVSLHAYYSYDETKDSFLVAKEIKTAEKALRDLVKEIGIMHTEGLTVCEIDEESISQKSDANGSSSSNESILSFDLTFDEE